MGKWSLNGMWLEYICYKIQKTVFPYLLVCTRKPVTMSLWRQGWNFTHIHNNTNLGWGNQFSPLHCWKQSIWQNLHSFQYTIIFCVAMKEMTRQSSCGKLRYQGSTSGNPPCIISDSKKVRFNLVCFLLTVNPGIIMEWFLESKDATTNMKGKWL